MPGSPPLARGIHRSRPESDGAGGITPACAGNTFPGFLHTDNTRDHPRLRGEYFLLSVRDSRYSGSPPLARGILNRIVNIIDTVVITPACAGNTLTSGILIPPLWDHPRLRGEYWIYRLLWLSTPGSPPLARGIPVQYCP